MKAPKLKDMSLLERIAKFDDSLNPTIAEFNLMFPRSPINSKNHEGLVTIGKVVRIGEKVTRMLMIGDKRICHDFSFIKRRPAKASNKSKVVVIDGVEFSSMRSAEKKLGLSRNTIRTRIASGQIQLKE